MGVALATAALGLAGAGAAKAQNLSQLPVFADVVAKVGPAVVNISTTKEAGRQEEVPIPQFPPGSPFEEFFKEFFDRDRPQQQQRRRGERPVAGALHADPRDDAASGMRRQEQPACRRQGVGATARRHVAHEGPSATGCWRAAIRSGAAAR